MSENKTTTFSGQEFKHRIFIQGFDEWGRRLSEFIFVGNEPVTSKNFYAYLGYYLPEDYIIKIPRWLFK